MTSHKPLIPNLMVEDVNETVRYYQEILGFTLLAAVASMDAGMQEDNVMLEISEGVEIDWANLRFGAVELMFQSRKSLEREVPALQGVAVQASMTLYVRHPDNVSVYESIRDKVEVLKEPHDKFYGMSEWYMRDLNGYILCFASEIAPS